jgi:hypothetical protein
MKNTIFILAIATFFASCEGMKTDLEIKSVSFPPKLCVTAILDGASDTFSIVITEARALADYKTPLPYKRKIIIPNGEIRLYEDDKLILKQADKFDMSTDYSGTSDGYRFETPVTTKPGSVYRLEVGDMDGNYEMLTSTSKMPLPPAVSVNIDTDVWEIKKKIWEYTSLDGWGEWVDEYSEMKHYYCPFQLQWGARDAGRNYYALEIFDRVTDTWTSQCYNVININIYSADLTKLQDNPEVEAYEGMSIDTSDPIELYGFPILLMSDVSFAKDNASLALYTQWYPNNDDMPIHIPQMERFHHEIILRVRHITEATFQYYRSLVIQSNGMGFFTEPVNIVGNIENGYGSFTVFSATDIKLLGFKISSEMPYY